MPVSTANKGIHANMTTKVNGEGGNPSPSNTPDNVADPSHFLSVGSFGKNIITIAPQSDNSINNGHQHHNGNSNIRHEANAHIANNRKVKASLGIREVLGEDCSGIV